MVLLNYLICLSKMVILNHIFDLNRDLDTLEWCYKIIDYGSPAWCFNIIDCGNLNECYNIIDCGTLNWCYKIKSLTLAHQNDAIKFNQWCWVFIDAIKLFILSLQHDTMRTLILTIQMDAIELSIVELWQKPWNCRFCHTWIMSLQIDAIKSGTMNWIYSFRIIDFYSQIWCSWNQWHCGK